MGLQTKAAAADSKSADSNAKQSKDISKNAQSKTSGSEEDCDDNEDLQAAASGKKAWAVLVRQRCQGQFVCVSVEFFDVVSDRFEGWLSVKVFELEISLEGSCSFDKVE